MLIAGDIASCDWSGDDRTADLIARRRGLVMTAGDNAYPAASLAVLRACYGPTWGRFKRRTVPALGNHDDIGAFFAYFGRRAGQRGRGYHAFDHGPWRVYVLDSNCTLRPGCASGTRQYRWLERDLRRNPRRCSMAVLHHPAYSSGLHGGSIRTIPLLRLLYDAGTDLVVNGHDHVYERFASAAPWGRADDDHGIRQFIVGTGGAPLYPFREGPPSRHSQVRQNQTHGVLKLTLREDRYAWKFLAVAGGRFRDEGEAKCHDLPTGRAGNRQRTPSVGGIAGRR